MLGKGSRSFLKKRTKKLLLTAGCGDGGAKTRKKQKFFASFFQKRSAYFALLLALSCCRHDLSQQDVPVNGMVPPLALSMTDVSTGKAVTAADFRGHVVLLYFGYTNCPDVCPTTLYNADKVLRRMGPAGAGARFLFVTVDPDRDTPAALAQYTALFGPQVEGLRGTPDQLYALARRYRVVFSVTKPSGGTPYGVTHSSAIYVFDGRGQAQFLIAGLDTAAPDYAGIAADVKDVALDHPGESPWAWFETLFSAG
jgi:protein SCO1/2